MQELNFNIYNNDMFTIFPTLPDKIVDLAVLDLPYGVTTLKWDKKIDLDKLWEQLRRVSTDTAVWIFFCDMKLAVELITSNREQYRFDLVWDKIHHSNGFNAKKRPLQKHEYMLVFTQHKTNYTYCLDSHTRVAYGKPWSRIDPEGSCWKQKKEYITQRHVYEPLLPQSIIEMPKKKGRGLHPTEKPEEIYEWIIKYFSREGNTVLDPCFGSGNSGIVARNMRRSYIGIELDPQYFEKASKKM